RIVGLDLGADDYMPKPCSPGELVARLRAILRRAAPSPAVTPELRNGPLSLTPGSRTAQWHDRPLDLTGTEFSLLEVLVRQAGHVVSKQELSQ
ncbi:response regulator transcription factor, partial [Acinetobacter baumannii]